MDLSTAAVHALKKKLVGLAPVITKGTALSKHVQDEGATPREPASFCQRWPTFGAEEAALLLAS